MRLPALSFRLVLATPFAARAKAPLIDATCGGGIETPADEGGPVCINGSATNLTKVGDPCKARLGGDTIRCFTDPDGSVTAAWTGTRGANGICTVDG